MRKEGTHQILGTSLPIFHDARGESVKTSSLVSRRLIQSDKWFDDIFFGKRWFPHYSNYIVYLSRVTDRCPSDLRLYLYSCPIKRDFKLRGTFNHLMLPFGGKLQGARSLSLTVQNFFPALRKTRSMLGRKPLKQIDSNGLY